MKIRPENAIGSPAAEIAAQGRKRKAYLQPQFLAGGYLMLAPTITKYTRLERLATKWVAPPAASGVVSSLITMSQGILPFERQQRL
jgi:hypothetical protein